jgi:hypothetical protein
LSHHATLIMPTHLVGVERIPALATALAHQLPRPTAGLGWR